MCADHSCRYVTIVRFDPAYHTMFRCNLKMIRHDYPHIQKWLMHLYYDETEETRGAFRDTTYFDAVSHLIWLHLLADANFDKIKQGYAGASKSPVVPFGPLPNMMPKT